jgi:hypothetical protein
VTSRHGWSARIAGVFLVLSLVSGFAFGQGVISNVKSPPLRASDVYASKLAYHHGPNDPPTPPWGGWAGTRFKVHVLDGKEVDGAQYMPGPMPGSTYMNTFPQPIQSNQVWKTFWHPNAQQSGVTIVDSVNQPSGTFKFHVASSNPSGNSDVDVTIMTWDIWHVRGGPGSTLIQVPASAFLLVSSQVPPEIGPNGPNGPLQHIMDATGGPLNSAWELPPPPTAPLEELHWAHVLDTMTFHVPAGPGSNFIALMANTVTIGIEHVPEPAAAVLAGAGGLSLIGGLVLRRRRNSAY